MTAINTPFPRDGDPMAVLTWYVKHPEIELTDPRFGLDIRAGAGNLRPKADVLADFADQCREKRNFNVARALYGWASVLRLGVISVRLKRPNFEFRDFERIARGEMQTVMPRQDALRLLNAYRFVAQSADKARDAIAHGVSPSSMAPAEHVEWIAWQIHHVDRVRISAGVVASLVDA